MSIVMKFTPPKRRFWKAEPTVRNAFPGESLFKGVSLGYESLKIASRGNAFRTVGSAFQNLRFGRQSKKMMWLPTQIIACYAYRCSYLRFSYPLWLRAESATFLFATMCACRNHKMMISWWCVCRNHKMISCACRNHTAVISWWCVCWNHKKSRVKGRRI